MVSEMCKAVLIALLIRFLCDTSMDVPYMDVNELASLSTESIP